MLSNIVLFPRVGYLKSHELAWPEEEIAAPESRQKARKLCATKRLDRAFSARDLLRGPCGVSEMTGFCRWHVNCITTPTPDRSARQDSVQTIINSNKTMMIKLKPVMALAAVAVLF